MCGITAVIGLEDKKLLKKMTAKLQHRGPDSHGTFIDKNVMLGHQRLSIVDLESGAQPMSYKHLTIVYNGEIYNHQEIRKQLKTRCTTTSDTETVLHAYNQWGQKCLEKINGMFAFAIYDSKRKEVFIARDRIGIKPLYVLKTKEALLFASEIKALLAYKEYTAQVDVDTLTEITRMRYNLGNNTLFKGITSIPPATYLIINTKTKKILTKAYWKKDFKEIEGSYKEKIESLFEDSVKKRLMSDVPLGIFLSGGFDSSAIAAYAQKHHQGKIKTFSIGFEQQGYNEFKYARKVAEHIQSDHHEKIIDNKTFTKSLPKLIWHNDEPITFQASVPLYHIADVAAKKVKVVLTGEGADELFAGYDKYYRYNQALKFKNLPAKKALYNSKKNTPLAKKATVKRILTDPKDSYQQLIEQNSAQQTQELIGKTKNVTENFKRTPNDCLELDQKTYLQELLRKQDRMSMATSIESRVPFLDHRMIELSRNIPFAQKMPGKTILKEALQKSLPKEILTRKKAGFPVPIQEMIAEQRNILDEKDAVYKKFFKNTEKARTRSNMEWFFINFELWHKLFIE